MISLSFKIILLYFIVLLDKSIHGLNNTVIFKNNLLGWNIKKYNENYTNSNQITVSDYHRLKIIEKIDNECLTKTFHALHAINNKRSRRNNEQSLIGTTYYINEFQAVGHLMYDIALVELLNKIDITRIILQRAPCATTDLCLGLGTWESFYKHFYTVLLNAAGKGGQIPIFMRFYKNATFWDPYLLGESKNKPEVSVIKILVSSDLCFDTVIRRGMSKSFYNSVSPESARKFKKASNELYNKYNKNNKNNHMKIFNKPIITIAHRGNRYRSMSEPELLKSYLQSAIPNAIVNLFNTSQVYTSDKQAYLTQVGVMRESNVIISTHGAFETNLIYMNENSLYLEIRGNLPIWDSESNNYYELSKMFLVHHQFIVVQNLQFHTQPKYNISKSEMKDISDVIIDYLGKYNKHI